MSTPAEFTLYTDGDDGVCGFDIEEVNEYCRKHGLIEKWVNWFAGQTGVILDGKFCVYPWDWSDFMHGRRPVD